MSTENIIDLANFQRAQPNEAEAADAAPIEAVAAKVAPSRAARVGQVTVGFALSLAKILIQTARYAAFFVLRWLKGPITFILGIVSGLSLLAAVIIWAGFSSSPAQRDALLPWMIGFGLGASILRFSYDWILFKLYPLGAILD